MAGGRPRPPRQAAGRVTARDRVVTALLLLACVTGLAAQAPPDSPAPDCAERLALIDLLNQSAAAITRGDPTTAVTLLTHMADGAGTRPCAALHGIALRRLALADSFGGRYESALVTTAAGAAASIDMVKEMQKNAD